MTAMERRARLAWEESHRRRRKQVQRRATALGEVATTVLEFSPTPETPLSQRLAHIDTTTVAGTMDDRAAFEP